MNLFSDFEDGEGDFDFTDMNEMFMQVLMSRLFGMNPFMRGGPVFINPGGFGGGGFHFRRFSTTMYISNGIRLILK
jgi:hypothetical protein